MAVAELKPGLAVRLGVDRLPWPILGLLYMPKVTWARMRAPYTGLLTTEISVAPGPAGRPGERLLSYSNSWYKPRLTSDGAREDFRVMLSEAGSTFAAVCLGPTSSRRTAAEVLAHPSARLARFRPVPSEPVTIAGHPTPGNRFQMSTAVLHDWPIERDGWLFVIGALIKQEDDEAEILARTRRVLATWRWIDPEPSNGRARDSIAAEG